MSLVLQLDASALGLANNDPVSTFTDSSASGNDATQSGAKRGLFKTGVQNGLAGVLLDGTDDYYKLGTALSPNAMTAFFVIKSSATISLSSDQVLMTRESQVAPYGLVYLGNATSGFANETFSFLAVDAQSRGVGRVGSFSGCHIWCIRLSGTTEGIWLDGALQNLLTSVNGGLDSSGNYRFINMDQIGGLGTTPDSPFGGYIHEIRVYDTALTTDERMTVTEALSKKWGVALPYTRDDPNKTVTTDGSMEGWYGGLNYIDEKDEDDWTLIVGSPGQSLDISDVITIPCDFRLTIRGASAVNRPTVTVSYSGGFAIFHTFQDGVTIRWRDFIWDDWSTSVAVFYLGGSGTDCFVFSNFEVTPSAGNKPHLFRIQAPNASPTGVAERGPYGVMSNFQISGPQSWQMLHGRDRDQLSSWQSAHSWSTADQVVFEDIVTNFSTFINGFTFIDGDQGFRFHLRHATLKNTPIGLHGSEGDNSNLDAGFQMQISDVTHTVSNGQTVAQLFFCRAGAFRAWNITLEKEGTGTYQDGAFFKTFYYRDTDTDFPGNPTLADRTYIDGTGAGGDDYVGTQMPGCGYTGVTGADPNYPSKPWGSVPMRLWNITYGSGVTVLYDHSLGTAFNQEGRDLFFSFDDTAKPAGWAELAYPHPLLGGDTTPPQLVSATINSAGTQLTLVFNEDVTGVIASDYTLSGGHGLSGASGSGTTWTMSIVPAVLQGETVTLGYGSTTKDVSGNFMPPFEGRAVNNTSLFVPAPAPTPTPVPIHKKKKKGRH